MTEEQNTKTPTKKLNKNNRDYRFIALTFLTGAVAGAFFMMQATLREAVVFGILTGLLFLTWVLLLFAYMDGEIQ